MRRFNNGYFERGLLVQFVITIFPEAMAVFEAIAALFFLIFGYGEIKLIGVFFTVLFIWNRFNKLRIKKSLKSILRDNDDLFLSTSSKAIDIIRLAYHRAILSDIDFELDLAERALSNEEVLWMLYRLGVDPSEIREKILERADDEVIGIKEEIFSNILSLADKASEIAFRTGGEQIGLADFLIASVILEHDELSRIFKAFRITAEDMEEALISERSRVFGLKYRRIEAIKKFVYRLAGKRFETKTVVPWRIDFFEEEMLENTLNALGKGFPALILEHYETQAIEFMEQAASMIASQKYFLGSKIVLGETIRDSSINGNKPRVYYFSNLDFYRDDRLVATIKEALRNGEGIIISVSPREVQRAKKIFGESSMLVKLPKPEDSDLAMVLAKREGLIEGKGLRMTVFSVREALNVTDRYFSGSFVSALEIVKEAMLQAERGNNKLVLEADVFKAAERLSKEEPSGGFGGFKKEAVEELLELGITRRTAEEVANYIIQYRTRSWREKTPISFFVASNDLKYQEKIRQALLKLVLGNERGPGREIMIDALEFKDHYAIEQLIGSDDQKIYGKLFELIVDNPRAIIMINNLSKASEEFAEVIDQMIAEGWLKSGRGELVDTTEAMVLIFNEEDSLAEKARDLGFLLKIAKKD